MDKTNIVKSAEQSKLKRENPKNDCDETVSAEEISLNPTSLDVNIPQIANSETKAKSDDYSEGKKLSV